MYRMFQAVRHPEYDAGFTRSGVRGVEGAREAGVVDGGYRGRQGEDGRRRVGSRREGERLGRAAQTATDSRRERTFNSE